MVQLHELNAIIYGRYTIIADVHFGDFFIFDYDVMRSYCDNYKKRIYQLAQESHSDILIINGDLKEAIGLPNKIVNHYLIEFLKFLGTIFRKIILIKGNHDGKIEHILQENKIDNIIVRPLLKIDDILITHGHRKIKQKELGNIKYVITGHLHPAVNISPLKKNLKAWMVSTIELQNSRTDDKNKITWIVLPAFSDFTYGLAINKLTKTEIRDILPFKGEIKLKRIIIFNEDLTPLIESDIDETESEGSYENNIG